MESQCRVVDASNWEPDNPDFAGRTAPPGGWKRSRRRRRAESGFLRRTTVYPMLRRANSLLEGYFPNFFPGISTQPCQTGHWIEDPPTPGLDCVVVSVSYHEPDGGGLLRPRQDHHLQV